MAAAFDKDQIPALKYLLNFTQSVASGIATSVSTGLTVGTAASGVGLAVSFFQIMFQGIVNANQNAKLHDMAVAWRADSIDKLFAYNQQGEELVKEQVKSEVEQKVLQNAADVKQAQLIHLFLAVTVIAVVAFLIYFVFPKTQK